MENKQTILIADDTRMDRMMIKKALGSDYHLLEAENGLEALMILRESKEKIDLVISDLMMPVMSGVDLLSEIHNDEKLRDIPVLIATSTQDIEAERRCLELGCWDFTRKPYDPVILKVRVDSSLERKELYRMKEQHIVSTFEHYVDPKIVDILLNQGYVSASGHPAEVIVLFADIRNFTSLSETLDSGQIVELLNSCFAVTGQSVKNHRGIIDKFIGDCTMGLWICSPDNDDVYDACSAAMEMIEGTKKILEKQSRKHGIEVSLGIGIHKGTATIGNIGFSDRMDFTVIGDTVNTASRLESKAPGGSVYISADVAKALGNRAKCTSLGNTIALKGKAKEVEVFTLDQLY